MADFERRFPACIFCGGSNTEPVNRIKFGEEFIVRYSCRDCGLPFGKVTAQ
jgi:hypothetical protein